MMETIIPFVQVLKNGQITPSTSAPELAPSATLCFSGTNEWCQIFCYHSAVINGIPYSSIRSFLAYHTSSVLVLFHADSPRPDIYAQSTLDDHPVVVQDFDIFSAADFPSLFHASSFPEFTFELDRKYGKRRLETKFVTVFKKLHKKLAASWQNLTTDTPEIRSQLALDTMLRLLFVAFLATRGTLDNRPRFIQEEAVNCHFCDTSIYRELIQPLFFETLNRPEHLRRRRAKSFGKIPFLNGGLFSPSALEKSAPQLTAPNEIWLQIITELFDNYSLSTDKCDTTPKLGLDPMMLGHIFESLMNRGKRSATGSYYTPLPLAKQVTADTMQLWFKQKFNLDNDQILNLFQNNDFSSLSPEQAQDIDQHLSEITILDPAAGSGAFLQCALELLHRLRTGLMTRYGTAPHPGTLARHILARNLYGVDILATANQMCELRLWLELVQYYRKDEPLPSLPNLDLNIQCGNALTDQSQYAKVLGIHVPFDKTTNDLTHLKHRYRLSTGYTKKKLARQIEQEMHRSGQKLFQAFMDACSRESQDIQNSSPNLFDSNATPTFLQRMKIGVLNSHRQKLQSCIQNGTLPGFSFDIQFSDILSDGGFDIILGNPPWFSMHTLPEESQKVLRTLYQTANPTQGTKSQSADISALFIEKSLSCIKPDGIVSMLIPNKLFYAPSYDSFRNHIHTRAVTLFIKDWTQASHNAFDAATYPTEIILQNPAQCSGHSTHLNTAQNPFIQSIPHAQNLEKIHQTIGDIFTVKRGLYTGANDLFIIQSTLPASDPDVLNVHFAHSSAPVPIEKSMISPIVRGANLSSFQYRTPHSILFTHSRRYPSKPLKTLPPHAGNWLSSHENTLRARRGCAGKPPHTLFGCSDYMNSMKVVWRDISQNLEACFISDPNVLPLNTVYFIPVSSEDEGFLLAAYLNSSIARTQCRLHAEHAQNNYRRYFAWVIEKLPWFLGDSCNQTLIKSIIKLSRQCHEPSCTDIDRLQKEIDTAVETCLQQQTQFQPKRTNSTIPFTNYALDKAC